MKCNLFVTTVILGTLSVSGLVSCRKTESTGAAPADASKPIVVGKFTILETITDGKDQTVAKRNAENAITKYTDVTAFVGLWSYNAPQVLEALKSTGKIGKIRVFAFDEDPTTLAAIADGTCDGTLVQQPYEFGYQSMKYLKDILDGKAVDIPANKEISVPVSLITKDGVAAFNQKLIDLKAAAAAANAAPAGAPKFAFVINNSSDFWSYAQAGLRKAEADFGISADFLSPAKGDATEQNRVFDNIIQKGDYKGVAVSPIEPENQTAALNKLAAALPLICHDSDAPKSNRRFYLGTVNVEAGRAMGAFIKKQLPEGGKIIITVGSLDALNAQQRREGLIEELGK
jgi:ribose transport system substrate-binding protein